MPSQKAAGQDVRTRPRRRLWIALLLLVALTSAGAQQSSISEDHRRISFSHRDGPYTTDLMARDFGVPSPRADQLEIVDSTLSVKFVRGKKVNETGIKYSTGIPERTTYTLQYRIKFGESFESGLHGKQFGLSGGKGYTGGHGEESRTNGDGWSVRLQFDAHETDVTNQLYVYHCGMKGIYGESLGTDSIRYSMKRGVWNAIKMKVTMQSMASASDGRIEVWCNGERKFDLRNVRLVFKKEGLSINKVRFESFPGGGGIVPTHDSFLYLDGFEWIGETR